MWVLLKCGFLCNVDFYENANCRAVGPLYFVRIQTQPVRLGWANGRGVAPTMQMCGSELKCVGL